MKRALGLSSSAAVAAAMLAAGPAHAVTQGESWLLTQPGIVTASVLSYSVSNSSDYSAGPTSALGTNTSLAFNFYRPDETVWGSEAVSATGSAMWTSASAGSVTVDDTYTAAMAGPRVVYYLPIGFDFNSFWGYTFTPATDAVFTMDYDVQTGGLISSNFGGWNITMNLGDLIDRVPLAPSQFVDNASGVYTVDLVAGQTYTVTLSTPGPVTYDEALIEAGEENATFDWSIAEEGGGAMTVPEPPSWTLVLTGFGLIGLCGRAIRPSRSA